VVIELADERFTKNLWSDRTSADLPALVNVADDNAQAGYIVENILANREMGTRSVIKSPIGRSSSTSQTTCS
jgi:DNA helicase-2/ATP-dependent DNA helicase PcrA